MSLKNAPTDYSNVLKQWEEFFRGRKEDEDEARSGQQSSVPDANIGGEAFDEDEDPVTIRPVGAGSEYLMESQSCDTQCTPLKPSTTPTTPSCIPRRIHMQQKALETESISQAALLPPPRKSVVMKSLAAKVSSICRNSHT